MIGGKLPVQKKSKKLFSALRTAHKNLSKIIAVDTGALLIDESGLSNKETIHIACDENHVDKDFILNNTKEIAIFPPVTGG